MLTQGQPVLLTWQPGHDLSTVVRALKDGAESTAASNALCNAERTVRGRSPPQASAGLMCGSRTSLKVLQWETAAAKTTPLGHGRRKGFPAWHIPFLDTHNYQKTEGLPKGVSMSCTGYFRIARLA